MVIISYYYQGHINLFKYDSGLVDCPLWHWKVIPGHTKYAPASSLCWSPSLGKCKGWVRQSIQHDKKIYAKLNMKINFMCLCDWLLWPLTGRVERKRRYKPIKVAANHCSFHFLIWFLKTRRWNSCRIFCKDLSVPQHQHPCWHIDP